MGKAMFTLIGAMAELGSALVSERVSAGMQAAKARGKHLVRPRTPARIVTEVEELARTTDVSVVRSSDASAARPGASSSETSSNGSGTNRHPTPHAARGPREAQGIAHAPRETLRNTGSER